jgi:hypothetical protein
VSAEGHVWVCRGYAYQGGCQVGTDEVVNIGQTKAHKCARCGCRIDVFTQTAITAASLAAHPEAPKA